MKAVNVNKVIDLVYGDDKFLNKAENWVSNFSDEMANDFVNGMINGDDELRELGLCIKRMAENGDNLKVMLEDLVYAYFVNGRKEYMGVKYYMACLMLGYEYDYNMFDLYVVP